MFIFVPPEITSWTPKATLGNQPYSNTDSVVSNNNVPNDLRLFGAESNLEWVLDVVMSPYYRPKPRSG